MQLAQLAENPELRLEVKAGREQLDRVVNGAYASDLLRHVMARRRGQYLGDNPSTSKYCGCSGIAELVWNYNCWWD